MRHSYRPIAKLPHTALTSPDHHLTLSEEKKNMKWNISLATDVTDDPERSSISSNGEDTPKAITPGNPMIKSTRRSS